MAGASPFRVLFVCTPCSTAIVRLLYCAIFVSVSLAATAAAAATCRQPSAAAVQQQHQHPIVVLCHVSACNPGAGFVTEKQTNSQNCMVHALFQILGTKGWYPRCFFFRRRIVLHVNVCLMMLIVRCIG